MILTGQAGTGKTHLLCDVAKKRVENDYPTVLLMGENFRDEEPWTQIIKQLHVKVSTKEEFLSVLDTAGKTSSSKALIIIDAINESRQKEFWTRYLPGMFAVVSRYPWVGLVVSVRGSYFRYLIPEKLIESDQITIIEHHGFEGAEYEAVKEFFEYYDIEYPTVPLLNPEFQNPQFLKIICQGLNNSGIKKFPRGFNGLTKMYNFFVSSVNTKLSRAEYLDYDFRSNMIFKAIKRIISAFVEKGRSYLLLEEAKETIKDLNSRNGFHESLFYYLETEQVINIDMYYIEDEPKQVVRLAYERFSDHFRAKHYIDSFIDSDDLKKSFETNEKLNTLFKDSMSCWSNRGLIEALSIQVPERFNQELVHYIPHVSNCSAIKESFFESIIWRNPKKINEQTKKYLNKYLKEGGDADLFFETLITVAVSKDHPYNSNFFSDYLMKYSLGQRDALWSNYIFYQVGEKGAVDRLVDWAWSDEDKGQIDDDSIYLASKMLAWFLTTSQRFLRDWTTKAMINLLAGRIYLIRKLLEDFEDVNDPYVLERLYAVAYGCAMRTLDTNSLQDLAQYIYNVIFSKGSPPVHILLRDYARNIVELALHYKLQIDCDPKKNRPPYRSEWNEDFLSKEKLREKYEYRPNKENESLELKALHDLYWLVTNDFSDFNKHQLKHTGWSSRKLGEPKKATRKEKYEKFIESLTSRQKKEWNNYNDLRPKSLAILLLGLRGSEEEIDTNGTLDDDVVDKAEKRFLKSLGKKKRKQYDELTPYLSNLNNSEYDSISRDILEAYIFNRILELGWNPKIHYEFDKRRDRLYQYNYRDRNKPEKISEKYRWIAFHELLAKLCDNYEYGDGLGTDDKYLGSWQGYWRDIDPSYVKRNIKGDGKYWWFTYECNSWDRVQDDAEWIKDENDLPNFEKIIEIIDCNGDKWLNLDCHFNIDEPCPPEEDKYSKSRKNMWFFIHTYLVRQEDSSKLFEWAKGQNFMGRWLPKKSSGTTQLFLGEFYWSPAFKYFNTPYYGRNFWINDQFGANPLPVDVALATDSYYHESGDDCSMRGSVSLSVPTQRISEGLKLSWRGKEGEWYNQNNILVACDPTAISGGPTSFLIKKKYLEQFLEKEKLDIICVMLGEKRKIGGDHTFINRLILNGVFRLNKKRELESSYNYIYKTGYDD